MKNSLNLLLLGLMCCLSASARERSAEEMTSAARSVLLNVAASADDGMPRAQRVAALQQQPLQVMLEKSNLVVVGQQSVGFAVIAKDTRHSAVWGYSDRPFAPDDLAPSFLWLMEIMDEAFADASAHDQSLRTNAKTAKVGEDDGEEAEITPIVTPLIKTHWYQKEPYNRLCPMVVNEGEEVRGVTGCVPTALAQFIYYYKEPTCGEGESYVKIDNVVNGRKEVTTLSADLSTMPWSFDDMLTDYNEDYTAEQALAVARLMQACGYICRTDYYPTEAAGNPLSPYSLTGDFIGYRTRELLDNGRIDVAECFAAIDDENPLFCWGDSRVKGYGHAFLIDGYDSQQFLHVNFGWGGREDGYYAITDLNNYSLSGANVLVSTLIKKVLHDGLCYDLNPATHEATVRPNNAEGEYGMSLGKDYVVVPSIDNEGESYTVTTYAGGLDYWANSVSFPASLEKITPQVIGFTKYLKYVVCHAPQPPEASGNFDNSNYPNVFSAVLYVPGESVDLYRTTEPWSNFVEVRPLEDLAGLTPPLATPSASQSYDLQGRVWTGRGQSGAAPVRIVNGRKQK